jgi:hypothetical protein
LPHDSSPRSRCANYSSTPELLEPQPLAAVAYDFDDVDDDDDEIDHSVVNKAHDRRFNSLTANQETKITFSPGVTATGAVEDDVNYAISRRNSASSGASEKGKSMYGYCQPIANNTSFSTPRPSSSSKLNEIVKSIHAAGTATSNSGDGDGNNTINAPYPPPSAADLGGEVGGKTFRKGAGGGSGGGGRHRCPKCGTDVTFKCDFEDNTFYCASCAGWFAGTRPIEAKQHPSSSRDDGPIYEEFIAKDMRNAQNKGPGDAGSQEEIILRHVSRVWYSHLVMRQIFFCRRKPLLTISSFLFCPTDS